MFYSDSSIYYTALIEVIMYALIINFNIFILIPKLFYKKNYVIYIVTVIIIVIGSSHLLGKLEFYLYLEQITKEHSLYEHVQFIKRGLHVFKSLPLMGLLFLTTIYYLGKRREEKQKEYFRERAETELRLLKNQINPHFLFNALNSVYTLSYIQSEMTPQMILKLSEMLRYVLYECTADKVTLEKELVYLENYITFQKLKEETEKALTVDFKNVDHTKLVAPMLFIPFIENSFKHSNIHNSDNSFITIKIETQEDKLTFKIENSFSNNISNTDKSKGIGLENVKRRLDLIYPDKYKLNIKSTTNKYYVELKLDLI